ncbi:hypothetical protein [Streptomyces sp. WAC01280]|uniref:hypothetical protein n=1 Tax=Streptomyces sp. WAC01280 TaxID=2487424 RepID=UPI000F76BA1D|nr:hypothetical protein [Streptomyces sp. WAC01280]RSS51378.1 hypothetical protein EF909_34360 [Streptomyces sp. WAC01280]
MPEPRSAQITLDGSGHGTIKINDVDISRAVRGLTLRAEVDELPVIELELLVFDVSTHVEAARFYVPKETEAVLIAMGWDPPVGHPDSQRTTPTGGDFVDEHTNPGMIATTPGP